jgi:hypothetical protein
MTNVFDIGVGGNIIAGVVAILTAFHVARAMRRGDDFTRALADSIIGSTTIDIADKGGDVILGLFQEVDYIAAKYPEYFQQFGKDNLFLAALEQWAIRVDARIDLEKARKLAHDLGLAWDEAAYLANVAAGFDAETITQATAILNLQAVNNGE